MGKRGPPNLGKTLTSKQRRVDVYLPTLEAKERWSKASTKRHQKVSEMVFDLVEMALSPVVDPDRATVGDLRRELEDARAELDAQRQRNSELSLLRDQLELELEEYRSRGVLGEDSLPKLDSKLVRLFSQARGADGKPRTLTAIDLRKALRVRDADSKQSRALNVSVEELELHGLVKRAGKGWCWNAP